MSTYDITLRSTPAAYDIALSDPPAGGSIAVILFGGMCIVIILLGVL